MQQENENKPVVLAQIWGYPNGEVKIESKLEPKPLLMALLGVATNIANRSKVETPKIITPNGVEKLNRLPGGL